MRGQPSGEHVSKMPDQVPREVLVEQEPHAVARRRSRRAANSMAARTCSGDSSGSLRRSPRWSSPKARYSRTSETAIRADEARLPLRTPARVSMTVVRSIEATLSPTTGPRSGPANRALANDGRSTRRAGRRDLTVTNWRGVAGRSRIPADKCHPRSPAFSRKRARVDNARPISPAENAGSIRVTRSSRKARVSPGSRRPGPPPFWAQAGAVPLTS